MIIVTRTPTWRRNREVARKPARYAKGKDWTVHGDGSVTVYDKRSRPIESLPAGGWDKVTRG